MQRLHTRYEDHIFPNDFVVLERCTSSKVSDHISIFNMATTELKMTAASEPESRRIPEIPDPRRSTFNCSYLVSASTASNLFHVVMQEPVRSENSHLAPASVSTSRHAGAQH
eukprot:1789479-Amphidinium_carterae.1